MIYNSEMATLMPGKNQDRESGGGTSSQSRISRKQPVNLRRDFLGKTTRLIAALSALNIIGALSPTESLARDAKVVIRVDTYETPRQLSKGPTWYGFAIEPIKVTPELAAYFRLPGNWPTTNYAFVGAPTSDNRKVMQSGSITLLNLDNGRTEGVIENPNPKENAGFGTNISFDQESNLMAVGGYGSDEAHLFDFAQKKHAILKHPNFKAYWGIDSTYPNAEKIPMEKFPEKFWPDGTTAQIIRNPNTGGIEIIVGGTLTISDHSDKSGRVLQRFMNIQSFDASGNHLAEVLAPSNSFYRIKFYCFEEPVPKSFNLCGNKIIWGSNKLWGEDRIYATRLNGARSITTPILQAIGKYHIERGQYGSTYAVHNDNLVIAVRGSESYESPKDFGKLSIISFGLDNKPKIQSELLIGEQLQRNIDITSFDISGDLAVIAYRTLKGIKEYKNRPNEEDNFTRFGFCNLATGKFTELPEYVEEHSLVDGVSVIKFIPGRIDAFIYGLQAGINETYRIEYRGALRKVCIEPDFLIASGILSEDAIKLRTPAEPGPSAGSEPRG